MLNTLKIISEGLIRDHCYRPRIRLSWDNSFLMIRMWKSQFWVIFRLWEGWTSSNLIEIGWWLRALFILTSTKILLIWNIRTQWLSLKAVLSSGITTVNNNTCFLTNNLRKRILRSILTCLILKVLRSCRRTSASGDFLLSLCGLFWAVMIFVSAFW